MHPVISNTKVQITKPEDYPIRRSKWKATEKYENNIVSIIINLHSSKEFVLTCGQARAACCKYQNLACPVCIQTHPCVARHSSYEQPDDSSENTASDRRMRNVLRHHLYSPEEMLNVFHYYKSKHKILLASYCI